MYTIMVYKAEVIYRVEISREATKALRRAPKRIAVKLRQWVQTVRTIGLEEVRKVSGFHDEPLKGNRQGQRSIRLSRHWRAIYVIRTDGAAEFVRVEEISAHDY